MTPKSVRSVDNLRDAVKQWTSAHGVDQKADSVAEGFAGNPRLIHKASRVGWADVRKPNICGHHRPMNVGLRTSAQPTS